MESVVAVDIGGTKIAVALVQGTAITWRATAPFDSAGAVDAIAALVAEASAQAPTVPMIGVACAGLVDVAHGRIAFAGNLGWRDFPLRAELEARLARPVLLEHDGRAAIWAEYVHGGLTGDAMGIVLGTGVGGGFVLDGHLHRGAHGFSGEVGHVPVPWATASCACGRHGCLEAVASGLAISTRVVAAGLPHASTGALAQAARLGDPVASALLQEVGTAVGQVVAMFANALDIGTVIIGGGFGSTLDIWAESAQQVIDGTTLAGLHATAPRLQPAAFGNDAPLLGVALLAGGAATPAVIGT